MSICGDHIIQPVELPIHLLNRNAIILPAHHRRRRRRQKKKIFYLCILLILLNFLLIPLIIESFNIWLLNFFSLTFINFINFLFFIFFYTFFAYLCYFRPIIIKKILLCYLSFCCYISRRCFFLNSLY